MNHASHGRQGRHRAFVARRHREVERRLRGFVVPQTPSQTRDRVKRAEESAEEAFSDLTAVRREIAEALEKHGVRVLPQRGMEETGARVTFRHRRVFSATAPRAGRPVLRGDVDRAVTS